MRCKALGFPGATANREARDCGWPSSQLPTEDVKGNGRIPSIWQELGPIGPVRKESSRVRTEGGAADHWNSRARPAAKI